MLEPNFFRIDLTGQTVPISWDEMHSVRLDILHFYEENLNEPMNVYFPNDYAKLNYWLYLSIHFEKEWAGTQRYAWLVERGCLAMLNGLALDVLTDQIWEGSYSWKQAKKLSSQSLPYVRAYTPKASDLKQAKAMLLRCFEFVETMTHNDIDQDGYALAPKLRHQAEWFCQNIVADYFRATAKLDF